MHAKVIYGQDNRLDLFRVLNPDHLEFAKSTAAMISNSKLTEFNAHEYVIDSMTLEQTGVCDFERFAKQPVAASCSGFLVAKDVLVTAGHCIRSQSDCEASSWVFDYKVDFENQSEVIVDKENVYSCKSIISRELNTETQNDYAVIKLTKEVQGRLPLKINKKSPPKKGDSLMVIGHPSGLPTKVADGASVRSVKDVYLIANLDTYGGNSGSAVFNMDTGLVEGILVRGETDYVWNNESACRISNRIGENEGRGEDVTLISVVKGIPEQEEDLPSEPAPEPRPELPRWISRLIDWLRGRA